MTPASLLDDPPPVLRADGLAKTYGSGDTRFDALKGVSLDVRARDDLVDDELVEAFVDRKTMG